MPLPGRRQKPVLCLAHVTNQMAVNAGDFEKGEADGADASLKVIAAVARAWRGFGRTVNITGRPDRCAVAVMAKAPRPGEVKTRLVPPLSEADAAVLSGCFIRDIAGNILAAAEAAPIEGYVAYSPAGSEEVFAPAAQGIQVCLPSRRAGLGAQPLMRSRTCSAPATAEFA